MAAFENTHLRITPMVEKEQNGISVVTAVSLTSDYVSIQHSEPLKKKNKQQPGVLPGNQIEARLCRKLCMLFRKGGLVLFDFPLQFSRSEKTEGEIAESLLLPQLEPLVSLQNSDLQGTLDPCDAGDFQEKM